MKAIWKYDLPIGNTVHHLPEGARILDVQVQDGQPVMWALVNPALPADMSVEIYCYGTGHEIPQSLLESSRYIGTIQQNMFVWHYFATVTGLRRSDI